MAGFNRKAAPLANRDALPQLPNSPLYGGRPFHRFGIVTAATSNGIATVLPVDQNYPFYEPFKETALNSDRT